MAAASRPVSDRRIRYSTALQRAGAFRDNPEMVSAFVNADVPLALALRSFDAYSASTSKKTRELIEGAGFSSKEETSLDKNWGPGGLAAKDFAGRVAEMEAHEPDASPGILGWIGDRVGDAGSGIANASQALYEGAADLLTGLWLPATTGNANETAVDRGLQNANDWVDRVPVGGFFGSAGLSVAQQIYNYGEGAWQLVTGDFTDSQKQDIDRSGVGAASYYFQDLGEKRMPVSDRDVKWLKGLGKYSERDVDAAREVVVTGALGDLTRSFTSLSPAAQDFVLRATSDDEKASELLTAMSAHDQNSVGGRLIRENFPNQEPGEFLGPGTTSRGIASAMAEVVATWHVDPFVLAAGAMKGVQAARWAVQAGRADSFDLTAQMLKASDEGFKPKGAKAVRFDQAMDTADQIVRAGVATPEAAKARQSWIRQYPGYDKTLDILIGQRNGTVGELRLRTLDELKDETKFAAESGRNLNQWVFEASGDGKPLWRFTDDEGKALEPEARAQMRAKVADELSMFIHMDAAASGREMTGSRLLLPGQVSINGKVRDKIAPVLEAFNRRDASVLKQLKETGRKDIDLDGHLLAGETGQWDVLVDPKSSEWLRNNYTFGITHIFSRGWRNFERTFSNKTIVPTSPDAPKVYGQLVSQFMPKRQAQMMTTMFAAASPAERWAMTRQTMGSLLNVMNLRNTPESQRIVEQLTKGLVPTDKAVNGYKTGGHEHYTTPTNNNIRVGDLKMPAAVHPWQLSDGIELPNWRELRRLANRNWLMNTVSRTADSNTANGLIRAWKSSKVTTWSNMFRQGAELGLFTAWRNPEAVTGYRQARKAVRADVLTRKVNDHDLERLANHTNNLDAGDLAKLEETRRSQPEKYVSTLKSMFERDGFNPGASEILARLAQDVDLTDVGEFLVKSGSEAAPLASKTEGRVRHLAMVGLWDKTRRVRAERARRKGGHLTDSPLDEYLDGDMAQQMLEAYAKQFGSAADSYAWNTAERSTIVDRQRITDAAGANISFRPVKVVNGYEWADDANPQLWAAELGRRMSDPTGKLTLQLMAKRALADRAERTRVSDITDQVLREQVGELDKLANIPGHTQIFIDDEIKLRLGGPVDTEAQTADELAKILNPDLALDADKLKNPDVLMAHLYGEHDLGAGMRANGARLQYLPDGTMAANQAERTVATQHAAQAAVDDLVHHLGGKVVRRDGATWIDFPDELEPLLQRVAKGEVPSAGELGKLPADMRPEGLVAPIYAPMHPAAGRPFRDWLASMPTRAYGAVVADPLDKLFMMPVFIANRRIAQGELTPLMEGMTARGLSKEQAAHHVEAMVNQRAVARTFMGTDNPMEKSVFSEMADKWLMFNRAQEDFLRRLVGAVKANPEGIARASILMQAGQHAGIVHYEPFQDEEGNTEYHLTFTYPGTALAQRVMSDAAAGLGLAPDEILRVPQFDGLKSQVRFLNPGFSNPLQFSANPMFGFALSGAEKIWPGATVELERLRRGLSGGEDFEGTEGPFAMKNILPSMFTRFAVFANQDDADGQFSSAMRSALMYAEAAGLTPDAGASPAEQSRYLDAVKATTFNIMVQRAVFGTFLPAAPQIADNTEVELDTAARLQGLPNLRAEFFSIRNEFAQLYPDNFFRADSEAVAEFARRYPGELIVNPASFSTGSTKVAGVDEGYVPYTIDATRWLMENQDFVRGNPTLAVALMPKSTADGDFSNEAYKLQLKSDLRTHKSLEEFYTDLTLSDDLDEYYATRSRYFQAAREQPALSKSVYAKMDDWEDGWKRVHPLASAELNRRANPDFVHAEVAPGLERLATGVDPLPESLKKRLPKIKEMYADYAKYRKAYMAVDYYDNAGRADVNKEFQRQGDIKWLGMSTAGLDSAERALIEDRAGPLSGLWNLMRVSEGR